MTLFFVILRPYSQNVCVFFNVAIILCHETASVSISVDRSSNVSEVLFVDDSINPDVGGGCEGFHQTIQVTSSFPAAAPADGHLLLLWSSEWIDLVEEAASSNTQKVLYCIFCLFTFLMMAIYHLFLYNKRTAVNDRKPQKMQTYRIKSKPILDSVVVFSCRL